MRYCIRLIIRKNIFVLLLFFLSIQGCSQKGSPQPELPIKTTRLNPTSSPKYYTVNQGDTLYAIGFRTGLGYKNIAAWNEISHPYKLSIGQTLRLFTASGNKSPLDETPIQNNSLKILDKASTEKIKEGSDNQLSTPLLELSSFVSAVLNANPRLEIAEAVWKASMARVRQESALDDPTLAYSFAPGTLANEHMRFGQSIQLSQKFPWPGKLKLKEKAARSLAQANQETIFSVRLNLIALAKQLYSDWYYIDQAIQLTTENLSLLEQFKKISKMRYQLGSTRKQDVLQADLEYSTLIHKQYKFNRKKFEILGQINTLLSRPANMALPPAKTLPDPVKIVALPVLQEIALDNYPELKALNAKLKALEFDQQRMQLNSLPDFKLNAGYNNLLPHNDKHFSVGVAVNLPLDQSKRQAARDEGAAHLKEANWYKTDLINQLAKTIQVHVARVEEFKHSLLVFKERLLPLAEQTMQAARQDYQAGMGDFIALIEAEKTLHEYRLQEVQSLTNYHRSMALLEQALGVTRLSAITES